MTAPDGAAAAALEAAALCSSVLNDGEAATRNLVHALKWSANDDAALKQAVAAAGGSDNASSMLESALKRPEAKDNAATTAALRRALSRVAEARGDKDRAFFEMLKAARKAPADGLTIDDVFRLALATSRNTEMAAFFSVLADDETLAHRQRATVLNKLGLILERSEDKRGALDAYTRALRFHEAKAPRRAAERLAHELGADAPAAASSGDPGTSRAASSIDPMRLPSFDDQPAVTPSAGPASSPSNERIERADLMLAPPPSLGSAPDVPADAEVPKLEAALKNLPQRAAREERPGGEADKTRRVPHVAGMVTAISTLEGVPADAPSAVVQAIKKKRKETKKEKTQKRRKPIAPGAPKVIVDNSSSGSPESPSVSMVRPALASAAAASELANTAAVARPTLADPVPALASADEPAVLAQPERPDDALAEETLRSPAPQPHGEHIAPTAELMPILAEPALSAPEMDASAVLSRALAALDGGDIDECMHAARELAKESPHEPRVLRLAAKALLLEADGGAVELSRATVALFVEHAPRHGDRATTLALEVRDQLPTSARRQHVELWLAGAAAAGLDGARVVDLLRDAAIDDAPDGPAFAHCERVLAHTGDAQTRDALYQAALRRWDGRDDGGDKRAALTQLRIWLFEAQSKPKDALPLHAQLAVDLLPHDLEARRRARRAYLEHGTPDERARFLARLARRLPGDEGVDVAQELLDIRVSVDDRIGAEAAAKDLLARRPGDARATMVLAGLLEDDPGRAEELADILRIGAHQAMARHGQSVEGAMGEARTFLERLASLQTAIGHRNEGADALVQVARLFRDETTIDRALAALDGLKRYKDEIALLEEVAGTADVTNVILRVRTLLRAADIARLKLQKRGKARELIERALDVAPLDRAALRALADLLVEMGDVPGAVSSLERLVAEERDPSERARTHVRIGRLLEEHLHKPADAIRRFHAAAEADPTSIDAWSALRAIARQRGESALLVEALKGLAGRETALPGKADFFRQIARVERDERGDLAAAEKAFTQALTYDPADRESLSAVLALLAARLQPEVDLDTALLQPNDALMAAARPVIAVSAQTSLPLPLQRLNALALSRHGERALAAQIFEQLIIDHPEDLATLMAFARHLAASPRGEIGAEARRLRMLEMILLHHAYSLKPSVQVDVWGDVTALRAATGDGAGARKAAKKCMALASSDELKTCLSDRAVRAVALALDDARDAERDAKAIVSALRLDADRSVVETERARLLARAAAVCAEELKDLVLARTLLEEALRAHPRSNAARDQMLDLDLAVGDTAGALTHVRELLARESDPSKKALLHLRLFRLHRKLDLDIEGAAAELKAALELDPLNDDVLESAEQFFQERKDTDGLDRLWSAQLRSLDRADPRARLKLLERLAQLRRYDRHDFAGAVEALEAMTSLDPDALKPREDAARLYTELGLAFEAVTAWRGVLERDPLSIEAWRGVLGRFAQAGKGDEAFAVASTMLALDIADHDVARVVRGIRPPFPRWPVPPKDPALFRKRLAHPLERSPVRSVLDVVSSRLLPLYARELKSFGLRRKDALTDKSVPPSVLLAVRTLAQLLNLKQIPPIYAGEVGIGGPPDAPTALAGPPFAALASMEPGIIVTSEVLKGGMTPERAFALGRAASWLQPHALMAAAVDAPTLRLILEGLVAFFLGQKDLERPDLDAEKLGKELGHILTRNRTTADESAFKSELLPALRDYVHARQQVPVADWRAGVGYSGDRVGFLMSTDLNAAFRVIKSSTGGGQSIGARLAIKELVLFSVSSSYLGMRKDLGLAIPELLATPLLDLG
jgi:tetratricopeptide (TPR) repeat protein